MAVLVDSFGILWNLIKSLNELFFVVKDEETNWGFLAETEGHTEGAAAVKNDDGSICTATAPVASFEHRKISHFYAVVA